MRVVLAAVATCLAAGLAAGEATAQPFRRVGAGPALVGTDAGLVFAGGLARPRPHLVDLAGDARLDLAVQDEPGRLRLFERTGSAALADGWTWRTDRLADADGRPLAVGEWVRFADADGDGDRDLLTEGAPNLVRLYRRDADGLRLATDALLRTDGVPVVVDRQNLPAAAELTGDGRLDLVYAQTDGTLTFFEGAAPGADGLPRFRPPIDGWQGIQIVGEFGAAREAPIGPVAASVDAPKHGASALDLVDVDDDGDRDIVWGDFFSPSLYLLRNVGTATDPRFVRAADRWPAASAPATSGYNATATGDVTGDGVPDLVVGVIGGAFGTGAGEPPLTVRTGQGGEAFGPAAALLAMLDVGTTSRIAALPDPTMGPRPAPPVVVVTTAEGRAFRIVLRDGAPVEPLTVPADWPFGASPAALSLDRLAVGTFDGRVVEARLDGSALSLGADLVVVPRGQTVSPAAGDVTGDGVPDLVLGTADGRVLLARGAADGTFALDATPLLATDADARRAAPALGDWSGDGRLDLAVGDESGRIRLFTGDGRGAFALALALDALPVTAPAFADLDADGDLDVVAGAEGGGLVAFVNDRVVLWAGGPPRAALSVRAFPNPARTAVRIDTDGRRADVTVVDALGRIVTRTTAADPTFDVAAWPAGLYAAHVATDLGAAVARFVVTR